MRRHLGMLLLVPALAAPIPSRADDFMNTFKDPAAMGVVISIAAVNKAMRDAAENPMDEWRRTNVRNAVNALSFSLRALSASYGAFKLNPLLYPKLKAMLGGFVDQGAPDNYKKFLISPDKRLIPKVGPGFPQDALKDGGAKLAASTGRGPGSFTRFRQKPENYLDPSKLGLKDAGSDGPVTSASTGALPTKKTNRIGFDDAAPKSTGGAGVATAAPSSVSATAKDVVASTKAANAQATSAPTSGAGATELSTTNLSAVKGELEAIESSLSGATIVGASPAPAAPSRSLEGDPFSGIGKDLADAEASTRRPLAEKPRAPARAAKR